ncbi:MAG: 23S rRNA (adenine(2030)-N(6))-methyltransferase RlmJ, partial [Bauldia sp.]|nr:23S rRNA (adenine(2030)-N(6))-methyltransferase RlmJ [Bauldia sp.]
PVLVMLLEHLCKKPKPFTVLDTHAGIGLYDLASVEAGKTGEWTEGIARVIDVDIPAASTYLDIVRALNPRGLAVYPGSPAIVRAMLRDDDRLIACELHPEDATALRRTFRGDRRIAMHARDGYEAIGAFVPPPTRRGLVFIDPPYEARDEFARLADALNAGIAKWPTGIFAAWYPLKDRNGIKTLKARYRPDNPPTLVCEFLRAPVDGETLAGSGILICNPPWGLEEKLDTLCRGLLPALGVEAAGSYTVDWWIGEG